MLFAQARGPCSGGGSQSFVRSGAGYFAAVSGVSARLGHRRNDGTWRKGSSKHSQHLSHMQGMRIKRQCCRLRLALKSSSRRRSLGSRTNQCSRNRKTRRSSLLLRISLLPGISLLLRTSKLLRASLLLRTRLLPRISLPRSNHNREHQEVWPRRRWSSSPQLHLQRRHLDPSPSPACAPALAASVAVQL